MTLARAGTLAILVGTGTVGAIGLYLTWSLLASTLQPASVREGAAEPRRTELTQPAPSAPALAPPMQTATLGTPGNVGQAAPVREPPAPELAPPPADAAPPEPVGPIEIEVADPKLVSVGGARATPGKRGLIILHIGDSHTSADFLTGELRRRLQARYGRGGTGYMTAGHPHIGVRSSTLKITASPGWTYKSLQKPDARVGEFWLSGYNAIATAPGETMSFASEQPLTFDMIEIEAVGQPGGGAIDIKLDGGVAAHYDLAATRIEPVVIRLSPVRGPTDKLHEVAITTTGTGTVSLASVSIYNSRSGVTYNSVGYVGAQVSLLNKMSEKLFADDLARIDPQIVVLSFGTNEASNEHLDIAQYTKSYERVIGRIKAVLPNAAIAVISPPDFNEVPTSCAKDKVAEAACRTGGEAKLAANSKAAMTLASADECSWHTPAKLAQIRDAQRDIAQRNGLVYWSWASIMPSECGAHQWFTASPPLMSRDHVHFTGEGYRKSAEAFLNTLIPMIEKVRVGANAIPNN
ncbi:MAG TPA: GDSL-type esterase/lipase family protein [Xanthobacteraceae bacterium]